MARTRAQRRRHTLLLTIALAATLLVLLFARDVSRSAHQAVSPRRSENRSFASLASVLLNQQDSFDSRLTYLLTSGEPLSRSVFAARLDQLAEELPTWQTEAQRVRRPRLVHDVNDVLAQVTEQRVDDYQVLLAGVARALILPWPAPPVTSPPLTLTSAQTSLVSTTREWNTARWGLRHEPGRVSLPALSDFSALVNLSTVLGGLERSSTLTVTRGIGISAVLVTPSPLPASAGDLLLPPTGSIRLGVAVSNASYVQQPVSLTIVLIPTNGFGVSRRQTMTVTLGPLASYAFVPASFSVAASEHASLTISLAGAPSGTGMSRVRRYTVIVSSSGNG